MRRRRLRLGALAASVGNGERCDANAGFQRDPFGSSHAFERTVDGDADVRPTSTPSPAPTASTSGSVLVVGPGQAYATLTAAVAAAKNGDTIDVVSGTYTNDIPGYIEPNVTIVGVGGMVHEVYTIAPPISRRR